MSRNLLIVGAGIYGLVAKEVAEAMGEFDHISFVDDSATKTLVGLPVIGTTKDLSLFSCEYHCIVVAIGNPTVRLKVIQQIKEENQLQLVQLISPKAYVSSSAQIGEGCIIEPMAVVHAQCLLGKGCLICAGAVVNHAAICGDCVQVDCNAVVAGNALVPCGVKVNSCTVFEKK